MRTLLIVAVFMIWAYPTGVPGSRAAAAGG
jgi:hypothetical protein